MEVAVFNIQGQDTGRTISLSDDIFGISPNQHAVFLDCKQFLANKRQGTHKAKGRAEITGSTRKLKKQKGTGTARAGSIKSPLFRGGGRAFGPEPRDYTQKLNKKLKQLARRSVLSDKLSANKIKVLEDFSFETPKTKEFIAIKNNLQLSNEKTLFVLSSHNNNVYLSSRNLKEAKVTTASELNTYTILKAKSVVLTEGAVQVINTILGAKAS